MAYPFPRLVLLAPWRAPWWWRLGRAIYRFFRPPPRALALPDLPPPSRSDRHVEAGAVSGDLFEELLCWLWCLDTSEIECTWDVIEHILAVRELGLQVATVAHVRFVISREVSGSNGTIAVERIRDKLIAQPRDAVDSALFGLAAAGEIDLIEGDQRSVFDPCDRSLVDRYGCRFDRVRARLR
jgi:hypothetical protein